MPSAGLRLVRVADLEHSPTKSWPESPPAPLRATMTTSDRFQERQLLPGYFLAVVVTIVAAGVTRAVQPLVSPSVTPPFILAVAVAALYGGTGPGVLAAFLSLLALGYWFFPPLRLDTPNDLARLTMFLVVAVITAWIAGTVQQQRWTAIRESQDK